MSRPEQLRVRVGLRAAATLAAGLLAGAGLVGCGSDADTTAADPAGEPSSAAPSPSETTSASPSGSATETPTEVPSASPTEEPGFDLPACDAVWVAGQQLPGGYEGCLAADGTPVDGAGRYCEFGKPIFTYGKRMYAVENGPVTRTDRPLAQDPRFQRAQRSCAG